MPKKIFNKKEIQETKVGIEEEEEKEEKTNEIILENNEIGNLKKIITLKEFNEKVEKYKRKNKFLNLENQKEIIFQKMHIDHYRKYNETIIRLYGVTKDKQSIVVEVKKFYPYFFVKLKDCPSESLFILKKILNDKILKLEISNRQKKGNKKRKFDDILPEEYPKFYPEEEYIEGYPEEYPEIYPEVCLEEEYIELSEAIIDIEEGEYEEILGYNYNKKEKFVKISVLHTHYVSMLRDYFFENNKQVYEANIVYTSRFMIDLEINGPKWIKIKNYKNIKEGTYNTNISVSLESIKDLEVIKDESINDTICPFINLSFDIECFAEKGFPDPKKNPVIMISSVIEEFGEIKDKYKKVCFMVNSCNKIKDCEIFCFKTEREMLEAWSKFIVIVDPDVITGYNIIGFDFPYILKRSEKLDIKNFFYFSKCKNDKVSYTKIVSNKKAMGKRDSYKIKINGRIIMDLFLRMLEGFKLDSYTLNFVSNKYLGEQKKDVSYDEIPIKFKSNDEDRTELCEYCIIDSELVLKIINKLLIYVTLIECCKIQSLSIQMYIDTGQNIKVLTQCLVETKKRKFLLETFKSDFENKDKESTQLEKKKKNIKEQLL